jgi:hypothetical protein
MRKNDFAFLLSHSRGTVWDSLKVKLKIAQRDFLSIVLLEPKKKEFQCGGNENSLYESCGNYSGHLLYNFLCHKSLRSRLMRNILTFFILFYFI